jgi:protein phosphatase
LTDVGRVRKNNEDAFLGLCFDAQEVQHLGKLGESSTGTSDFIFAVSDGMGGASAGEFASRVAIEKLTKLMPRAFRQTAMGMDSGFGDVLEEVFEEIHKALLYLGESYEECSGMGTTLSLGWFSPGWLYFAHIGDSRIYYCSSRDGSIRQVTHDDTYVGWLYRNGKINEREARSHPQRNVLQRALGAGHQFVDPQVGAVAYEAGDLFVFCTDGVTDGLFEYQILEFARMPGAVEPNPARRLIDAALERSGRDNTTTVVVEVLGDPAATAD